MEQVDPSDFYREMPREDELVAFYKDKADALAYVAWLLKMQALRQQQDDGARFPDAALRDIERAFNREEEHDMLTDG